MTSKEIYDAIDLGGGQTCDIEGVLRELDRAGFMIVKRPTNPGRPKITEPRPWELQGISRRTYCRNMERERARRQKGSK